MPVLRIAARALVVLLLLIGAITSGWSGLAITGGLVLLALAAQLLITGRARWAFITGPLPRSYGAGAIAAAVAVFIAGGAASSPAPAAAPAPAAFCSNCTAVREAGAAPIRAGDPGYSSKLDRDGDGIACET